METSRERVLKSINHVEPETTPVHIMGSEVIERWLEHFAWPDPNDFDYAIVGIIGPVADEGGCHALLR